MYNNVMCTFTVIDTSLEMWQQIAEVVDARAKENHDDVPHNDRQIFDVAMHSRSKEDWRNIIMVAQRLNLQHPEMFNANHNVTLQEVTEILLTDYPDLFDDQNPLDYHHRKRVPLHRDKKMSHWGFRAIVMLREVWNHCEVREHSRRNKELLRQQQQQNFHRIFEEKHGRGSKPLGTLTATID